MKQHPALWLFMVAMVVAGSDVHGQEAVPSDTAALEDHPEVDEVLQALDEAGVPPTREELARFLETVAAVPPPGENGVSFPPFKGDLALRTGWDPNGNWDRYGRVNLAYRWLRVRARFREHPAGAREANGAVELGTSAAELRMGDLGMVQGFGLLMGAPGRRSSLAADGGLGPPRARLVTWLGVPDPHTLTGWAGYLRRGAWQVAAMTGQPASSEVLGGEVVTAVRVSRASPSWEVSCALMKGPSERGGSLTWGIVSMPLRLQVETMLWQPNTQAPPSVAAVGQVAWSLNRSAGVEFQWGFADQPQGPLLANRPSVLPGWSGRGFAVRGFVPLAEGVRLRVLVYQGQLPDRTGTKGLETKSLVDVQLAKRIAAGVEGAVRYRSSGRFRREWSERFPWQPAQATSRERHGVLTMTFTWEKDGARARVMARSYGRDSESGEGRRSLASVSGRLAPGRGWTVRWSWATAWGDPVDLVSAVSPLRGMVLPRHWGHWRSETVLGLEWAGGGVRVQAAVSRRVPEFLKAAAPDVAAWAQAGWVW